METKMTHVLEVALAEVAKLSLAEQDALGAILLDEIKSEQRWSESLSASQDVLKIMAGEAQTEHRAGKTRPLDQSL